MKYYSLKSLLMFFENQVSKDFVSIKNIVSKINSSDESSLEEAREFIFKSLRDEGMIEEGFEKPITENTSAEAEEITFEPDTRETLAVLEQFEVQIGNRIYHLLINLN